MLIKDEAENQAESVFKHYWDGSFPVKPAIIAEKLGIKVFQDVLPDDTPGIIVKEIDQDPEIHIQINDSPARQSFTCAHEIGHFIERTVVMEQPDDRYSFVERRGGIQNIHEFFANEFAGNLLMPERQFREYAENNDRISLAAIFGVSPAAVALRMSRLGLS